MLRKSPGFSKSELFYVVEDASLNVFTIPGGGGKIYVHAGLLKAATDSELAGVLGHEIGHAYGRHQPKSLTLTYRITYLSKGDHYFVKTQ